MNADLFALICVHHENPGPELVEGLRPNADPMKK